MNLADREKEILKFWKEKKIFEKSLKKNKKGKCFVFYDGPPFATGLPHYGHILSSTIKDVVPRYWTMKGYYVPRRWGWDCHGLPIENLAEKELSASGKKEIEKKIGIEKFNDLCRKKVLMYTKEWKKMVDRIGRWVDFDNAYKTMDSTYIESVWWGIKQIWDKGLIYKGRKVLMYCPRCETPVSKAETAMDNSYKNVEEEAVTVKFKLKENKLLPKNTYALAWTTTPWTLPGNVALAVNKKIDYVLAAKGKENYLLAKSKAKDYKAIKEFKGKDLVDLEYEPLYKIETDKKAWYIADADFVNTEEGTGIVHIAVVYGEDDYQLGLKEGLPVIPLLNSRGVFNEKSPQLIRGKYFKNSEDLIKKDLGERNLLLSKEKHIHPYPFCWRCETQLYYNAVSAWFINIQKVKKDLIKLNEKISWYPNHLKHGRFLNILKTAPDWNISRNRFWASPLPIWKCRCGREAICVGSVKDLKSKAINFDDVFKTDKTEKLDLHRHNLDKIKLKCSKCSRTIKRTPGVADCWMESASMPFAELHYPFENKEQFKKRFPAQYIAEYIAQTRTWFYYMHVMAVLLFGNISYENVVSTGTVLNEKGEKLSKSKQNYTDPWEILDNYGADALRFYLMGSSVMKADNLFFADRDVREARNKVINILDNTASFYELYGREIKKKKANPENVLDKWILSRLNNLILEVAKEMDNYNTVNSCRLIRGFVDDLSLWYVRRSRSRFKQEGKDKEMAASVLQKVLVEFSKVIAPFIPFTAENIYVKAGGKKPARSTGGESVHLEDWPKADKKLIDGKLEEKMEKTREIASSALAKRAEAGIKVRQPLAELKIKDRLSNDLLDLIKEEVNVKKVSFGKQLKLDMKITKELKREGEFREWVRSVNSQRKKLGLTPKDAVIIETSDKTFEFNKEKAKKEAGAKEIIFKKSGEKIKITKIN